MPADSLTFVILLISGALLGLSKTGIPGVAILAVALMAYVFPNDTKMSVGVVLPILIFCDFFAIAWYRRDADWHGLWRMFPFVVAGILPAWWLLGRLPDHVFRIGLGAMILVLLAMEWGRRRLAIDLQPKSGVFTGVMGVLAGFSSTIANAGGPVMTIYLLSRGMDKTRFVGTCAWFFFLLNLSKVLPTWDQGLITTETLMLNLWMLPTALIGVFAGIWILPRIDQRRFEQIVWTLTAVSAVMLIVK